MTHLMEYGPNRPATEAAKIGNALYRALVKIYGEYELSSSCTENGSP